MNNLHITNCRAYTASGIKDELFVVEGKFSSKRDNIKYKELDANGSYIVPGFIDTHIHGIGGFGTEDDDIKSILGMSDYLIKEGVTSFFPTVYTDTLERIVKDEETIINTMGKEKGSEITALHIEGPFISPKKIGAQNPLGQKNPSREVMQTILDAGKGKIKAMTMAPELDGIETVVSMAKDNGIVCLCGHTNATYEEAIKGAKTGIKHTTHLFNAMTEMQNRAPGVIGAVLSSDMTCEIICDGKHVHPANVKNIINSIGKDRVVCITDSLKPTKLVKGPFFANGVELEMGDNIWVTKGNTSLIQGSCLTMREGFKNIINWGFSIETAIALTSTNPARIYSLTDRGEINEGKRADMAFLNSDFSIKRTFVNGEERYVV